MRIESSGTAKVFFPSLDRKTLIDRLRAGAARLRDELPLRRLTLFGSWAEGEATAFSDVDVLVVYDDPHREDAFAAVRDALDLHGLEPHIYTTSEAETMKQTLDRMTRRGVEIIRPPR